MYQVRSSSSGKPLNFRLCDTQGLEEGQGIDAHDIVYLLDGNVPDGYQVIIFCRLLMRTDRTVSKGIVKFLIAT